VFRPNGGTTWLGIGGGEGGDDTRGDVMTPEGGMEGVSNTLSHVCTRSQGEPFVQSHCDTHFPDAGAAAEATSNRLTSSGQRTILTSPLHSCRIPAPGHRTRRPVAESTFDADPG
jgi:hypothetical protein